MILSAPWPHGWGAFLRSVSACRSWAGQKSRVSPTSDPNVGSTTVGCTTAHWSQRSLSQVWPAFEPLSGKSHSFVAGRALQTAQFFRRVVPRVHMMTTAPPPPWMTSQGIGVTHPRQPHLTPRRCGHRRRHLREPHHQPRKRVPHPLQREPRVTVRDVGLPLRGAATAQASRPPLLRQPFPNPHGVG